MFLACKNSPHPAVAMFANNPKKDSIILINRLTANVRISLYDLNVYETNVFPITFKGRDPAQHKMFAPAPVFLLAKNLSTVFMINPGEHVEVRSDEGDKPVLSIENNLQRTSELSFFNDLYNKYPQPVIKPVKITTVGGFRTADSAYGKWFTNAAKFLADYHKSHRISQQFVQMAGKYLYYKRAADLLGHIYNVSKAKDFIKNTPYAKFPANDSCVLMPHYRIALYYYNKILVGNKSLSNSFIAEFDTAKANFTGITKKILLFTILNSYIKTNADITGFNDRINYFSATYPLDTLNKFLKFTYDIKGVSAASHSAFDESLLTADNKLIKCKDILLKNKGKVILIDFWARYCGPCVYQIPFSQKLEKEIDNKNIVFVYVSFDSSKTNWIAGMDELNFQNRANSYFKTFPLQSNIMKFYNLNYIPKYVVYNKKGDLVNKDAPRPSDAALKVLLNKLLSE